MKNNIDILEDVAKRRIDVLFRDPNPRWDPYCEEILDRLNISGEFTLESWADQLDSVVGNTAKVASLIS